MTKEATASAPGGAPVDEVVAMTPEIRRALEGLHDLQLQAVGGVVFDLAQWAPLIPLIGALLLSIVLMVAWLVWHPKGRAWRRWRALDRQRRDSPGAAAEATAALAALLRQVAVSRRGGGMPPGFAGERWLDWLDAKAPPRDRGAFTGGAGRVVAEWPYQPGPASADLDALFLLARRWLWANA